MGSPKAFGTNSGMSDSDGGLVKSLLDSATLSTSLEDNSAFLGLSQELNTGAAKEPFASELDRLLAGNKEDEKQKQDFSTNPGSPFSSAFDNQQLFAPRYFLPPVPSQPQKSTPSNNATKDPLTGQTINSFVAIKSEGTVTVNGGGDFDGEPIDPKDDALIHAGKGFTINGNTTLPVRRDALGNPLLDAKGKPLLVDKAVTVAPGYTVSKATGNYYANLLPPQVVDKQTVAVPAYADAKQQELTRRIPFGTTPISFNAQVSSLNTAAEWTKKFPPPGTAERPTVVNVTSGGLNIPTNVTLSNYVIIVERGDINFNGSGHNLNDVVLVANNGSINLANVQAKDLSAFASGSINTNGGARFAGSTLLVNGSSSGNITFNGATATTNPKDNLKAISQGDITFNGASDTRGTFLTTKNFTFNGKSTLYGSIGAKGNITFNGKATVVAAFPDAMPPAITANLANDTAPGGTTNTDKITSDPTITGTLTDTSRVTAFKAGFDDTPASNFIDVLANRNPDGSFTFDRNQLETIYGSSLPDGSHTLHLVAVDEYGNRVDVFDFTFTLDTTAPTAAFGLAPAMDSHPLGDRETTFDKVTLLGRTEANAAIVLQEKGSTTTTDATGQFEFSGVDLALGQNGFNVQATDIAGNQSVSTKTIFRLGSGDFDSGLTEWTVNESGGSATGRGSAVANLGDAILTEGDSFIVGLERTFDIPTTSSVLTFTYGDLNFDTIDTDSIKDAFEVALVDEFGRSLVHTIGFSRDAFFNITEGQPVAMGAGTTVSGQTVSVNLSELEAGSKAKLLFRLVNDDSDVDTSVSIKEVQMLSGANTAIPGVITAPASNTATGAIDFSRLSDVSAGLTAQYGQTSFNEDTNVLATNLAVRNTGQYSFRGALLVGVTNLSDPTVRVLQADGVTPDGIPYYDYTRLVADGTLSPDEITRSDSLTFYNPQRTQFTYDLTFLGQLNQAPTFVKQPDVEAIVGRSYVYDALATDLEGDSLTYSLLSAPSGMVIDSATGQIFWSPSANNIGTHAVTVSVADSHGGEAEQHYTLSAITPPPNRPPLFTSTPVVDANVNTPYIYQAAVQDVDGDVLTFSLVKGPEGMTVNANTGVVTWTPSSSQVNTYDVTLRVVDSQSGTAEQTFKVLTQMERGNYAPIITSNPITQFGITTTASGAELTTLHTIVRDMRMGNSPDGHPDFERFLGDRPGMVKNTIGADRTPVLVAQDGYGTTNAATFYQWYHDVPSVNQRVDVPIVLTETTPGSGIWEYKNYNFFPIDNQGFGNQGYWHNFAFTTEIHTNFTYKGGEVFNFVGDDDVWVFINDKLIVDLGGVHPPKGASINLDTLNLTPGTSYTFELFSAERHTDGSTLVMQTSLDFGSKYFYKLQVADADNDSFKYELVKAPAGMLISADGTLSWEPKLSQLGIYPITVKVTDAQGGIATQSFDLQVTTSNPGKIQGTVYRDANGDGTQNVAEVGLQGRIVYIDENQNGKRDSDEISTATDTSGKYAFTDLPSGTYNVAMEPKDGWQVTKGTGAIILGNGQTFNNVNIGSIEAKDPNQNHSPYFVTSSPTSQIEAGRVFRYQAKAQDPDGDGLVYSIVTGEQLGIALDSSTGVVAWQPSATLTGGTYDVLLQAKDPYGGLAQQAFQAQVVAPNTAPVFTNFPTKPIAATVNSLFQYQFKAQDAEGNPITYSLDASAPSGATIDSTTGVLTWKLTETGNSSFNVSVSDNRGGTTKQSLFFQASVGAANASPVIASQPRRQIALGQSYLYAVNASDPNNDLLTFSLDTAPVGMTIDSSGKVFWQPSPAQIGSNPVSIKVSDGRGGVITQVFSIDVVSTTNPINQTPSITSSPALAATVNKQYQYDLAATDPDNDPLVQGLDKAPTGMIIDPETGIIRWTPTVDQVGNHEVTVRVLDAQGGFTTQTFTLTVRGANVAPTITSTPLTTASVGKAYTYAVLANDIEADALRFSLANAPIGMTIDAATGLIQWTPEATQVGTQNVEILVEDAQGGTTTQRYALAVSQTAANSAPAITSTPKYVASVGEVYKYTVTATDPEGETPTFALLEAPVGMTIDPITGQLQWTPTAEQAGTHYVTVGATDANGAGGAQRFQIAASVNTPPTITSTPVLVATAGASYKYDIKVSDPERNPLSYSLEQAPQGMTLDAFGRITWNPSTLDVGNYPIVITVKDERGAAVQQSYTLNVTADTLAPKVSVLATQTSVNVGSSVTLIASSVDNVKVENLQLMVNGTPVMLDANGRATVTMEQVGEVSAIATAIDAAGNSGQASTKIQVIDPTDTEAPSINLDLGTIASRVITAPTDIIGSVTDSNLAYYTLEVAPIGSDDFIEIFRGTQSVTNGVLGKFDPSLLSNDTYTLRLSAFDANGHGSTIEDTVSVAGDLKLGNFQLSFTDLSIPVSGIPISLTRTYDTLTSNTRDDFGYGWRMEFRDTDLRTSVAAPDALQQELGYYNPFKDGTRVYITLPGGKREGFTFKPKADRLSGYLTGAAAGAGISGDPGIYHPEFVSDKGVTSTLTVSDAYIIHSGDGSQYYGMAGVAYNPADSYFGGKYTLTTQEGMVYEIDGQTGDLLTVTNPNGNKLTYTDADISSSTGQKITFGRDAAGRITTVTDPLGKQIHYQYDAHGDLVSVTDRENNTTQFEYNDTRAHYLDQIIDPLGRTGVRNEYDAQGRLVKMVDAAGNPVELAYDPANSTETVKDALGNPTTYEYDARGNVVTEIDALGGVTRRTFDENNNPLTQTDPEGNTYTYTYDSKGNLTAVTDPLGNVTRYTFNSFGEVLTKTNPLGNTTTYTYDSRGNRLALTNARGDVTRYNFDANGRPISLIAADGSATQFKYDSLDNLVSQVDALGNLTTYTYDSNGNQLTETTTITSPSGIRTLVKRWEYDTNNRVTAITDAEGNVTRQEYDKLGNLTAVIDPLGRRTEYQYNAKGEQIATVYADGTSERTIYDAAGREIATIDQAGQATHFVYDALGRQVEVILPDSTPNDLTDNPRNKTEYDKAGQVIAHIDERGNRTKYTYDAAGRRTTVLDALGHKTTYTYNAAGNRLTETNALNYTTQYGYDVLGRPSSTRFADGSSTSTIYDVLGRRSAAIDQAGRTTRYEYDALNHITAVTDPLGNRTTSTYDEAGRVFSQTDANGNTTTYEYDGLGRRTAVKDALGNRTTYAYDAVGNRLSETDALGHQTRFAYDLLNRPVETYFADGTHTTTTYDALGRNIAETDQAGMTTYQEYDAQSRLTAVIDAIGQRTTYGYDLAGNLIRQTDANGHSTNYEYDALNHRTAIVLPLGQRSTTAYDAVGNVLSTTNANGHSIGYQYDALNRRTKEQFTDGTSVSYTYTVTSKPATITDTRGVTTYTYDGDDRLISRTDPDGQRIQYTYDRVGNRTSVIIPAGTTSYTYDALNRLDKVADSNIGVTDYTYDAAGNLVKTELPNSTVETRAYDKLNRLISLENRNSRGIISSQQYTLNAVGNRTAVMENGGRQVQYTYDNLHRLTTEASADLTNGSRTIQYTYDPVGNRLSRNDSVEGLTTYTYNANDRLLNETLNGQTTNYTYDNNGNTLSRIKDATDQIVYRWDDQNRLIGANVTTSTGTHYLGYRYNHDGIRVASIVDGQETRYLIDANQPYAQVVEEYTPGGTVQASYVYGHDLISQNRSGLQSFYHVDGLGSTRALTDASGNVTDTYNYDAYGNLIESIGSSVNNYRYTGEQYDPNLGDYYLRARYYDPGMGRFTAMDPFEGMMTEPLSLTKYPYVHGNPVNLTDPSGLFAYAEVMSAMNIIDVLAATTLVGAAYGLSTTLSTGTFPEAVSAAVPEIANVARAPISIAGRIAVGVARSTAQILSLVDEVLFIQGFPVIHWGNELPETTQHTYEALHGLGNGFKSPGGIALPFLGYIGSPGWPRGWLNSTGKCTTPRPGRVCDEYPYASTIPGGFPFYELNTVSVKMVPAYEQLFSLRNPVTGATSQGTKLGQFYTRADVKALQPLKMWFGVGTTTNSDSYWVDRDGIPHLF